MEKHFSYYTLEGMQEKIEKEDKLKLEIQKEFKFEIIDYILDDIIQGENFQHICLITNLAVLNNRLTKENAKELRLKLKQKYNVENFYDRIILK